MNLGAFSAERHGLFILRRWLAKNISVSDELGYFRDLPHASNKNVIDE